MCVIYNVALQETLLLSCFWVVCVTFVSMLLNKVLSILRFFFSQIISILHCHPTSEYLCHILVVNREELKPSLNAAGTGAYLREGPSPPKAERSSNAYTTAASYRESGCGNPTRVGFEPWFICGTVFLFLSHHYVRLLA